MAPIERRDALLEIGKDLFGKVSYDQLSMDDVAAAAKISKGLLYHYFPTKRAFYIETVRTAVTELTVRTAPDPALPPVERLRFSLVAYLEYVTRHAATYRRMLESGLGVDEEVKAIVDALRNAVTQRVVSGLDLEAPDDILLVALRGWVGFIEAASLAWLDAKNVSQQALLELLVTNLAASIDATGTVVQADSVALLRGVVDAGRA